MLLSKLRRTLPGSKHEGEVFEGLDLRHALMGLAEFKDCTFRDTKLFKADMRDATFINCTFDNCDLTQAIVIARLYGCRFVDCNLDAALFNGADIRETWFKEGRAEYADFSRASMFGGGFKHVNMHGARLEFAQTDNVDFQGSNLWGAVIPISCAVLVGNHFDTRQIHSLIALLLHSHWNFSAEMTHHIQERYKKMVNRLVRSQQDEAPKEAGRVIDGSAVFSGQPAAAVADSEAGVRDSSDYPGKSGPDTAYL